MFTIGNRLKRFAAVYSNSYMQTKLILMNMITLIIPIGLLFVFTFSTYIRSLNDQLISSEFRSLSQFSMSFENYLNELRSLYQSYTNDSSISNILQAGSAQDDSIKDIQDDSRILNHMKNIISSKNEVLGCFLFCEDESQYMVSRGDHVRAIADHTQQTWYLAAKQTPNKSMLFAQNILDGYVRYSAQVITFVYGLTDTLTGDFLGSSCCRSMSP